MKRLSTVFGKKSRHVLTASLLAALAGCSTSTPTEGLVETTGAPAQAATPVVQAFCPPVVMLDQTAIYRAYAKGGQDNPDKLLYQASLADATRQCTANETMMTINVVVQGRLVEGPAGAAGKITLPMSVDVVDGDKVIYSQKVAFPIDLPTGGTQFIFQKADVQIPNAQGGASRFARVRVGFDNGPAKKPGKRG